MMRPNCKTCKYPYDIRKWPCEDCLQGDRWEAKSCTKDNMNNKIRFDDLRKRVMAAIADAIGNDGHCKSYEGTFEWTTCYPNYFEDEKGVKGPVYYMLELHCYVLGPSRHYKWTGKTRAEVLNKAEKEISEWLEMEDDNG